MRSSAPICFDFKPTVGVNHRGIEAVNRLLYLVPHTGLAVLHRLVKAEVIGAEYPAEVRRRPQNRATDDDRVEVSYQLNITAATDESSTRAADAIGDFLQWNNAHIAKVAEALEFPKFEHIEVYSVNS